MPYPPLDGGSQVMHYTTLGLMNNGVSVDVLAMNPTRLFTDVNLLPEEYVRASRFRAVTVDTRIRPLKLLLNLFKKESYFTERFSSKDFEKAIIELLRKTNYEIVQLEHLYLCKYISTIRKSSNAKIILRPQNVEHIIWQRYIRGLKEPVKKLLLSIANRRLKKFEQEACAKVHGIIALTDDDARVLKSFGNKPVTVVAMGFDYEKLKNYDFEKQYNSNPVVYHLGSMDWLPNEEAVRWLLSRVLPKVTAKRPALKIIIAGRRMPAWVYKYRTAQVEVKGEIKDPLGFQEDKPIMVVPLHSGSGIRAKIIEGLALGKTIISTAVGAQGINCEHGKNILIADDEDDFAELIVKCSDDSELCKEIGRNARKLSEESYHYNVTANSMKAFYTTLTGHG
jgi:polysaccharide biosynthesis protein PslH